jgi:hypothetical protein
MATTCRKPFQSDLTDEPWAILQPLMPPAKPGGRPRELDMREVLTTPSCPATEPAVNGICCRTTCFPKARSPSVLPSGETMARGST